MQDFNCNLPVNRISKCRPLDSMKSFHRLGFKLMNQGYRIRRISFLIKNNFPRRPFTALFTLEWMLIYSHFVERILQARVPVIEELYQLSTNYPTVWCSLPLQSFAADLLHLQQCEICPILFVTKMDVWTEWQTWVVWLVHKLSFVTLRTAILYGIQHRIGERHDRRLSWPLITISVYCWKNWGNRQKILTAISKAYKITNLVFPSF